MADYMYNDSELQMNTRFILCIEEYDGEIDKKSIDTRLFIGYSVNDDDYYVRGKRQDFKSREFVPYAFRCESTNDLYDFIKFTLGRNKTSVILYNFNNVEGYQYDELPYEFFESHIDKNYEVGGYDNVKLKRRTIEKYLRMLKNMYNWDNNA